MHTKSMDEIIAEQPFFNGIEPVYIKLFAGCASNKSFKEGKFLLKEGGESSHLFIIKEGRVSIDVFGGNKGAIKIQTLGAGDLVGWSWLIPPYESQFDAVAVTATHVIAFDGKCLRNKCKNDYKFGYEMLTRIIGVVIDRLKNTRLQLIDIYG